MLAHRVLVLIALVIAAFMIAPPTSPLLSTTGGPAAPSPEATLVALTPPSPTPLRRELPPPTKAKGIVISGYTAGGKRMPELLRMIERTELNAIVLDIKNESGEVSWIPRSERARSYGGGVKKISDPAALVRDLHERDISVIGRIVVFKDPILSEARPDLAVQDTKGGIWRDRKSSGWGDPYSDEVWEYAMDLAREAVSFGFDEIQFDYIRFPSDGDISRIRYPFEDLRPQTEVIREHLSEARSVLHPMGAYTSADLFGFVTLVDDPGIGQRLELIAREVDYVSLMLYPSHYTKGNYNLKDPEASPYETIKLSLEDAKRRIAGSRAKLRPWLQDFSLRVRYSPAEVRAQIRAAEDVGVDEWLLWNASNRFQEDALRPATARPSTPQTSPSPTPSR